MPTEVTLRGEGAAALRLHLATHLGAAQLKRAEVERLVRREPQDELTSAELRLAVALLRELRDAGDSAAPTAASLLRGVRVLASSRDEQPKEKSEAKARYLAKRREKLQRLDEEMRYGSMVRNVKPKSASAEMALHQKSVKQHLSVGANMVAARVTAFVAVYFVARALTDSETVRIIAGLGGAITMMVLEMVLFIARATRLEAIEQQQQKQQRV